MSSHQHNPQVPLQPTYTRAWVKNGWDALILFEACLQGLRNHCARRPHDRERETLVLSGNVFVYEEQASGIKRWTDGCHWSPSRILNNFLVYRELTKAFPPGEKKKAKKNNAKRSPTASASIQATLQDAENRRIGHCMGSNVTEDMCKLAGYADAKEAEKALMGSLTDSYDFKQNGLIKKTISISNQGITHHLVSYYTAADVLSGALMRPSDDPALKHIIPRPGLISEQNFRFAVKDEVVFPEPHDAYAQPLQTQFHYLPQRSQSMPHFGPMVSMPPMAPIAPGPYGASQQFSMSAPGFPNTLPLPSNPHYHHPAAHHHQLPMATLSGSNLSMRMTHNQQTPNQGEQAIRTRFDQLDLGQQPGGQGEHGLQRRLSHIEHDQHTTSQVEHGMPLVMDGGDALLGSQQTTPLSSHPRYNSTSFGGSDLNDNSYPPSTYFQSDDPNSWSQIIGDHGAGGELGDVDALRRFDSYSSQSAPNL